MSYTRLKSFDSLRGLMMFLVILGHLMLFSYGGDTPMIHNIYVSFHVPVFFFVSGYFFNLDKNVSIRAKSIYLTKKAILLILPALFFTIITHIKDGIFSFIVNGYGFYWFLPALFWSMFICYIVDVLAVFLKIGSKEYDISLCVIGLAVIIIKILFNNIPFIGWMQSNSVIEFVPYLILGIIFRRNTEQIRNILTNRFFLMVIISLSVFVLLLFVSMTKKQIITNFDITPVKNLTITLCALSCFFCYQRHFESNSMVNGFLAIVGKYTLPIYVLHYFFLPDLNWLRHIIGSDSTVFVLIILIVIDAAIIGLCILFTKIISISDFLGHYLLGQKSDRFKY